MSRASGRPTQKAAGWAGQARAVVHFPEAFHV